MLVQVSFQVLLIVSFVEKDDQKTWQSLAGCGLSVPEWEQGKLYKTYLVEKIIKLSENLIHFHVESFPIIPHTKSHSFVFKINLILNSYVN